MSKSIGKSRERGGMSRRSFLSVGSLSPLGIGLAQLLAGAADGAAPPGRAAPRQGGQAQACLLLWLEGGPSQVDTWDPKPNSNFKPASTKVSGVQISELFPRTARQMDKLSVIRSVRTEENNHPQGTYNTLTG